MKKIRLKNLISKLKILKNVIIIKKFDKV